MFQITMFAKFLFVFCLVELLNIDRKATSNSQWVSLMFFGDVFTIWKRGPVFILEKLYADQTPPKKTLINVICLLLFWAKCYPLCIVWFFKIFLLVSINTWLNLSPIKKSSAAFVRAWAKNSFGVVGPPVSSGNRVRFFDASCDEVKSNLTINKVCYQNHLEKFYCRPFWSPAVFVCCDIFWHLF